MKNIIKLFKVDKANGETIPIGVYVIFWVALIGAMLFVQQSR